MRRKDTEWFINEARKIHGDKYDYSKAVYTNNKTKVCIICPIHGEFYQTPKNHITNKQGCPQCGKEYAQTWRKGNFKHFLENVHAKFGDTFSYPSIENEFENTKNKITIKCNKCGNVFIKIAADHLSSDKGGCKQCFKNSFKQYLAYEDLLKYNVLNLNIEPYEGEREYREKCTVICPIHGPYDVIISSIMKGKGKCKKCAAKPRISVDEFKKSFYEKGYDKWLECSFDEYEKYDLPITFKCKKCGYEFERTPISLISHKFYSPCPNCTRDKLAKERTKTTEEFIEQAKRLYGEDAYDFSMTKYISSCDNITLKCNKCGRTITRVAGPFLRGHGCPYHNCNSSLMEKEIATYIKSLGESNVLTNDRTALNGNELDIFIPNKNIAVEFDGIYWHSEIVKDNDYHINKTITCEKRGIRLIHIFEDEWIKKQEIVKSLISNILGHTANKIYARKCKIKDVPYNDALVFLDSNHLQGKCPSSIRIGLYYNDELVSLMTFGKTRYFAEDSKSQYELLRFCNKKDTVVVGGASKLFKHFISEYNPTSIISYADRRWSQGNLYIKLGFTFLHYSKPNYYYVIGNERKNRFNFRKSELIKRYGCPKDVTEKEFCFSQKWYRIYDCGCICYKWNKPN